MEMYLTYDDYIEKYHGTIEDEDEFERMNAIAQSFLDNATRHRIRFDELSENDKSLVLLCLVELVDSYGESTSHKGISSESIGDMSVSYGEMTSTKLSKNLNDIVLRWLGDLYITSGWV